MSAGPKVGDITSRRWKQRQQTVYWGRWWRWKKPGTVDVLLSLISCRSSPADKIHKKQLIAMTTCSQTMSWAAVTVTDLTHTLNIAVPSAQCILDNPRFQTNVKEKRTKYFIYGLQWVTELINSSVNVYRGQREGPSLPLTSTGPETSLLQPQVSPPGG